MLFEPTDGPRVFGLPPGADFPQALMEGLIARSNGQPPEALARIELIVNTRRMARRLRNLFDAGAPRLLPRIKLLTDIGDPLDLLSVPNAVSPLRRRLQLVQLVGRLLDQQPDLAPRASLYDLADSLAELMDEMHGEGVSPDTIARLDVTDLSGHWARAQQFLGIVQTFFENDHAGLDSQTRLRRITERIVARWDANPPDHPVILAGSTGSRGTTMMLMEAVARLPQGAVILPGFDFDMPASVWQHIEDGLTAEDHPQYRFRRLMQNLDLPPDRIDRWYDQAPPSPERNQVLSLALRPAPVTDAWLAEGPDLPPLDAPFSDVTLVEASSPRDEALAIALRLRAAAEEGLSAALITPDRMLTRQVTAALDRWNILPDDSAGQPLNMSPPGRFLRHVLRLFTHPLTGEGLLTLLKHPLCHDGSDRNEHLLLTRDLELHLRKKGIPFPDAQMLLDWSSTHNGPIAKPWGNWLATTFTAQHCHGERPLAEWVTLLRQLAERAARGNEPEAGLTLWDMNAGQKAKAVLEMLNGEAEHGGEMSAADFAQLVTALLSREEVRDRDAPHPSIMIWGTLEARVQGADLLILAGLNEGTWPEAVRPDPWLNRSLRNQAGLLLPERRIGLSAHDFQQAIAAREVWLTRSVRSEEAQTVPSRWLNRLTNLLGGLPDQDGPGVLAAMLKRGQSWLNQARQLDNAPRVSGAARPSPRPPVGARPRTMSVTEIKTLIRDPFAIYAKHVLRLKPLDPLVQMPDARLRGIIAHKILETFIRQTMEHPERLSRDRFLEDARRLLGQYVPWPTARVMWQARLARVSSRFLADEAVRQSFATPFAFERRGQIVMSDPAFTLRGVADRIDINSEGQLFLYDYKTGEPPSAKVQRLFDKQLLLEAAIAEKSGFEGIGPKPVMDAVYIGLGPNATDRHAPLEEEPVTKVWTEFVSLIRRYFDPNQGFTARLKMQKDINAGDYDQLARFGEWDMSSNPEPETLS